VKRLVARLSKRTDNELLTIAEGYLLKRPRSQQIFSSGLTNSRLAALKIVFSRRTYTMEDSATDSHGAYDVGRVAADNPKYSQFLRFSSRFESEMEQRKQRKEAKRAADELLQQLENERLWGAAKAKTGTEIEIVATTEEALTVGRLRLIPSMRQLIVQNGKKKTFLLTDQQLKVFQILFEMHLKGTVEPPTKEVFKRAGISPRRGSTRTRDLFQSRPGIWGKIVKSGTERGTISLVT
jgi:hypothetical protein